jgi:hypothetical protein
LQADVAIFTGWCADADRQALPASPETVAAFTDAARRWPAASS